VEDLWATRKGPLMVPCKLVCIVNRHLWEYSFPTAFRERFPCWILQNPWDCLCSSR